MQEYALEEIKGCIKFIEEQTGEKFDRDAYFAAMKVYNRETEYELLKNHKENDRLSRSFCFTGVR